MYIIHNANLQDMFYLTILYFVLCKQIKQSHEIVDFMRYKDRKYAERNAKERG